MRLRAQSGALARRQVSSNTQVPPTSLLSA